MLEQFAFERANQDFPGFLNEKLGHSQFKADRES